MGWSKTFVDIFIDAGFDVEVDVRRAYEGPKGSDVRGEPAVVAGSPDSLVSKYISNIFSKPGMPPSDEDNL